MSAISIKKSKSRKKVIVVVVVLVLLISIATLLYFVFFNQKTAEISQQSTATNTEIQNKENEEIEKNGNNSNNTVQKKTLQPPNFSKSSGNNGPVPVDVLVNFICNSEPNTTCQMVLTNGDNTINLEAKSVKDNGRGQYFASWDWNTIKGKWTVFARANRNSETSDSTKQTLEVK